MKKNCETNPITSAGILVIPEIEGQRSPANSSAGWNPQCARPLADVGRLARPFRGGAGTDSHGRTDHPKEGLMANG
jgi:hypothetical protein